MSVYKKLVVDLVAKYKIYTFLTEPMSECTLCLFSHAHYCNLRLSFHYFV